MLEPQLPVPSRPTPKQGRRSAGSPSKTKTKKEAKGKRRSAPANIATSNAFARSGVAPAVVPPSSPITASATTRSRATSAILPSFLTAAAQTDQPLSDRGKVQQPTMAHTPSHWLGQSSEEGLFFDLVSQHTENLYQHRHYEDEHDMLLKGRFRGDMDGIHADFPANHSYPSTSDLSAQMDNLTHDRYISSHASSCIHAPSTHLQPSSLPACLEQPYGELHPSPYSNAMAFPHMYVSDGAYQRTPMAHTAEEQHTTVSPVASTSYDSRPHSYCEEQQEQQHQQQQDSVDYLQSPYQALFSSVEALRNPQPDEASNSSASPLTMQEMWTSTSAGSLSGSMAYSPVSSTSSISPTTRYEPLQPAREMRPKDERVSTRYRCQSSDSKEGTPACDFCRKRKVKCDRLQPTCSFCSRHGMQCTSEDRLRKRGPPTKVQREEMRRAGYVYDRSKRRWRPEAEVVTK